VFVSKVGCMDKTEKKKGKERTKEEEHDHKQVPEKGVDREKDKDTYRQISRLTGGECE